MYMIIALIFVVLGIACGRVDLLVIALGFSLISTIDLGRFKIHIIHETRKESWMTKTPPEKNWDQGNQ